MCESVQIGGYEFHESEIKSPISRRLINRCGEFGSVSWQFDAGAEAYLTREELLAASGQYFDTVVCQHTLYLIDHQRDEEIRLRDDEQIEMDALVDAMN